MRANPMAARNAGSTVMHFAALHGHEEILQVLLAAKGDCSSLSSHGWTPLHVAAGRGHVAAVKLLLEWRASVWARTPQSLTARDISSQLEGPDSIPDSERPQRQVSRLLALAERAAQDAGEL